MKKIFPTIILLLLIIFAHPQIVFAATDDAAFTRAPSDGAGGFTLTFEQQKFNISAEQLDSWQSPRALAPENIFARPPQPLRNLLLRAVGQVPSATNGSKIYDYNFGAIYNDIKNLTQNINKPSVEPALKIENNLAINFTPPQTGLEVDVYKSAFDVLSALQLGKSGIELTVNKSEPKQELGDTNNLGITKLIAQGVSGFAGSPKNRRHNIAVGIEKFKGLIIKKGEEFSFNKYLGPVEAENGFLPELVIKSTGTVPEFGGGLCQVSSTTFRAAMAAGLPITARKNHAYAVQYYSPQGTDATIYPGSADLKFINDTPGAILVWPYLKDKDTLIYDFYGTDDGRKVTLEKPEVYDRQTSGAMKATWTRKVVGANGKEVTSVFKSVYQSPALFHKTEQFVNSNGAQSNPGQAAPPGIVPVLAPPI